jgi:hypothetical protein
MSKNSAQQRLDCFKDWLRFIESKRKRNKKPTQKKNKPLTKYHPALEYDDED